MILKIEPDYLFLYNDILILYDIYLTLKGLEKRFQINLYMDLVYPYENISIIQELNSFCDKIFVFSSCWKKNLIEMKVPSDKIFIFPHGFDSKTFCCIKDPRKNTNFNINDFLILNTNRNTSRKCLDLTIQSFTQFLLLIPKSKRKNVYLLLNQYENETTSYDIQSIISMEEGNHSISISNQIIQIPNGGNISDQDLNLLYHISDIGLNTCNGEGFGLCNLEHGGIGKPQVITSCGAFQDIFNDDNSILVPPSFEIYVPKSYVFHEGLIQMVDPKNVANGLLDYYLHPNKKKLHGKNIKNHIANHYHWQSILTQFYNDFF
jgi:glycosyltransferase involved in cell wall biosynthesis